MKYDLKLKQELPPAYVVCHRDGQAKAGGHLSTPPSERGAGEGTSPGSAWILLETGPVVLFLVILVARVTS